MYNWEYPRWPLFEFDQDTYVVQLRQYTERVDRLLGRIQGLPAKDHDAYFLERLVEEAATTSRIEGYTLSRQDLMSSVLNNLNLGSATNQVKDLRARAIGQQIVLNRETFTRPLTETALKYWHELLLGYDTTLKVTGDYRQGTSPMRIVSGPEYKQVIHFIAPPANRVAVEMEGFIAYCNSTYPPGIHPVLSAGIAHLYFESIHPFEDGNGRIGRAILEKMLSQQLGTFIPFSISHSIEARRKAYYVALNTSQTTLDITSWLNYFCEVLLEAIDYADSLVDFTLHKQTYFNEFATQLDPHHRKAIDKLFAAGPAGFQGGMSTRKYMYINRVSQATAARALRYLTSIGALTRHGSGRSTHYLLPQST